MQQEFWVLAGSAAGLGFIHTILGPDHYLPFIALSKARGWTGARTAAITLLCGLGHVMGSVLLGLLGVLLGTMVFRLESIESVRGELAGWLLVAFGLLYFLWGIRRALRAKSHAHRHEHADGSIHSHDHRHIGGHAHVHAAAENSNVTPWVLFIIFVLGPCEPLIPLILYPAARFNTPAVVAVAGVFGVVTIATMLVCVLAPFYGLSRVSFPRAGRYAHALAGLTILLCGSAIQFLGW